jgi:hypothetical protein
MRLVLPLYGLAIGAAIGWLLSRLPIAALTQSVAAALIAYVLASVGCALIWARSAVDEAGAIAVDYQAFESVVRLVVVGICAAVLHLVFGWLSEAVHLSLGSSRPVILGSASGLLYGLVFGVAVSRIDTLT